MKKIMALIFTTAVGCPAHAGIATCVRTVTTGLHLYDNTQSLGENVLGGDTICLSAVYKMVGGSQTTLAEWSASLILNPMQVNVRKVEIPAGPGPHCISLEGAPHYVIQSHTTDFVLPDGGSAADLEYGYVLVTFRSGGADSELATTTWGSIEGIADTSESDRWEVPDTISLVRGTNDAEAVGDTYPGPVGPASGTLQYHDTSHTGDEDAPHIVNLTTGADDAGTINPGDKWGVRLRGNTPGEWTGTITAALTCP
ncbi:hypothetical protein ACQYE5_003094 [Enterobacter cancerogenus]